ncbi:hypothetical protein [Bombella mellum]|uniref:hypothetical protein n=1 Tax=Bombella mellum TaxID=2039288 RepID=UPI0015F765EB|nr:hypothetical protein [Bombella mellum]
MMQQMIRRGQDRPILYETVTIWGQAGVAGAVVRVGAARQAEQGEGQAGENGEAERQEHGNPFLRLAEVRAGWRQVRFQASRAASSVIRVRAMVM